MFNKVKDYIAVRYIVAVFSRHKIAIISLYLTWGAYFTTLFLRMIRIDSGGIWAGHINVWSDWSVHIAIANTFAFKTWQYWFSYNPLYAGGRDTYPFFADFISGMLMRSGISLPGSFIIPSIFFSFLLIGGIYFLGYLLMRSRMVAGLGVFMFFLTPSFGFLGFITDFIKDPALALFLHPVTEYSRFDKYDWYSGNVITGLLVPQRAFLAGLTLGVWAMIGLVYCLTRDDLDARSRKIVLLLSGIIAGILPSVHPHSFIVIVLISACICAVSVKKWRTLLWYIVPATIISCILYYTFILGGIESKSFMSWFPGWTALGSWSKWVTIWFWISGLSIPVALLGWFAAVKGKVSRSFFVGIGLLFILANLFLFQPIRWDNSKLFFWSFLGFSFMGSGALCWLWKRYRYIGKVVAILLFLALTATGILEVIRLQNIDRYSLQMINTDNIKLGMEIRDHTDPLARFLTAPQHNHPVMMWGIRPILMGYTAWVLNYGFLYSQRESDMARMFLGGEGTDVLLRQYQVSYVYIGPAEKGDFHANEAYFAAHFPLAFKNNDSKVYDTRSVLEDAILKP